jgi:hypothetical protein
MDKKKISELTSAIIALQNEAVKQTLLIWKPQAERIISTNSIHVNDIEHTLDALCEVAYDKEVLIVFKKLCRYYFEIDPKATVEHIQIYREMWDNNEKIESEE